METDDDDRMIADELAEDMPPQDAKIDLELESAMAKRTHIVSALEDNANEKESLEEQLVKATDEVNTAFGMKVF